MRPSIIPSFLPSFLRTFPFLHLILIRLLMPFLNSLQHLHPSSPSTVCLSSAALREINPHLPSPSFFFLLLFSILLHNFSLPSYFFSNLLAFIPPPGVAALVLCFPDEFLFLFNHFSLTGFTRTLPWSSWSSWSV